MSALEWGTRQSEKVVKLTCKAQPEYDFTEPLYTHPQPRQPLMDEQINNILKPLLKTVPYNLKAITRAIEAAHGIGGEK